MIEEQAYPLLLRIPAQAAADVVDEGFAEYHYAEARGVGTSLVEIGVNAAGGVAAVVLIMMTKAAASAVSRAIRRHRPAKEPEEAEVRILPGDGAGDARHGTWVVIVLDDAGTGLFELTGRLTSGEGGAGRAPS